MVSGSFLGGAERIALRGRGGCCPTFSVRASLSSLLTRLWEMVLLLPPAGPFGVYAETYLSPWAGFTVRATYALIQIIAIGAEVTAVAIYFTFWFPSVPQWIWVVGVSIGLVALNTLQVARFGEFEYWFAFIKVLAIVVFIVVGLGLILGLGPRPAVGLSNLTKHGGFLPYGWRGVWLALTLALTSYMGVEIIAVTAGEAERPEEAIPRALRTIVFLLVLFYVLTITIILALTPWNHAGTGTGITGSPFVSAFSAVGIPYVASIMNLVVITAALSSSNTDLYLTTRMLFSLLRGGYAPAWLW